MKKTFQKIISPGPKTRVDFGPGHEVPEGIIESIFAVSIVGSSVVVTGMAIQDGEEKVRDEAGNAANVEAETGVNSGRS